jgi:hypothetical protein
MRGERDFWLQIEMAMNMQLIRKLEEVLVTTIKHQRLYGTRIHFTGLVNQRTINKLAEHLETIYNYNVYQDFPCSLLIWHKSGNNTHA